MSNNKVNKEQFFNINKPTFNINEKQDIKNERKEKKKELFFDLFVKFDCYL